jgi:hypothetical protein
MAWIDPDGSIGPGRKLAHSPLWGKNVIVTKHFSLFFSDDIIKVIEDISHFYIWLVSSGSTMAEHSFQHPKVKGLSQVACIINIQ